MQDTDRHMEEIWTVLTRVKSTGFLELIINHRSFSQTVENLFALSFLVSSLMHCKGPFYEACTLAHVVMSCVFMILLPTRAVCGTAAGSLNIRHTRTLERLEGCPYL